MLLYIFVLLVGPKNCRGVACMGSLRRPWFGLDRWRSLSDQRRWCHCCFDQWKNSMFIYFYFFILSSVPLEIRDVVHNQTRNLFIGASNLCSSRMPKGAKEPLIVSLIRDRAESPSGSFFFYIWRILRFVWKILGVTWALTYIMHWSCVRYSDLSRTCSIYL